MRRLTDIVVFPPHVTLPDGRLVGPLGEVGQPLLVLLFESELCRGEGQRSVPVTVD